MIIPGKVIVENMKKEINIKTGNNIQVLVYRKCSTCLKALKWLENNNIKFDERAIVDNNPTYEELKKWYEMSGFSLKKFFNTSGLVYKELGLKDKITNMSEDEMLKILSTNGKLVKRPVVVGEDFIILGFKEKEWIERIKKNI